MSDSTKYRVQALAIANVQQLRGLLRDTHNFGDLHNQASRAALSVMSNIAEGLAAHTPGGLRRGLAIARGSNAELAVQLQILIDDPDHPLHDAVDHVGRMLTKFIGRLT